MIFTKSIGVLPIMAALRGASQGGRLAIATKQGRDDMNTAQRRISRVSCALVLSAGLGLFGSLAMSETSVAAVPPTGNNCVASEGKIDGRGATDQAVAQEHFAQTYRDDFCGATGTASTEKGEAGNTMVAYNYPSAAKASDTGSGAGLISASCRTDAFAGSGLPYSEAQLKELDEAPETLVKNEKKGTCNELNEKLAPPFAPLAPWPNASDATGNVMSFPIAGYAESIPVHLTTTSCPSGVPASLSFTAKEVDNLFSGNYKEWTEKELVETNPELNNCAGAKITRVVREDNDGADTSILKTYLTKVDNKRELFPEGTTKNSCIGDEKRTWEEYNASPDGGPGGAEWPGKGKAGTEKEGECSKIVAPAKSGASEVIKSIIKEPASVGYASLAEGSKEEAKNAKLILASVQNATKTSFQAPNAETGSNCDFKTLSLPGVTQKEAVGLNQEESWATNNPAGNHGNATDLGAKYPICGITFDLVYADLDNGEVANPISRLSADQRRTLYSYFTFTLSSAAQETLTGFYYAALPPAWLGTLRGGFQSNF
jgi:ABC-type phosphate transport system substrate-binding protein